MLVASPLAARDHGIAIVHQELTVVPELTVAGEHLPRTVVGGLRQRRLDRAHLPRESRGPSLPSSASRSIARRKSAGSLSPITGRRDCPRDLLPAEGPDLDGPTSWLPAAEVSLLLSLIRRLAGQGNADHLRLPSHGRDSADRAERDGPEEHGPLVATEPAGKVTTAEVVRLMIGGEVPTPVQRSHAMGEQPVVLHSRRPVDPGETDGRLVRFAARADSWARWAARLGEDGIAAGDLWARSALRRPRRDSRQLHQERRAPRAMLAAGVGFAPEDRKKEGLALNMSVSNNLVMACQERVTRAGFLLPVKEEEIARTSVDHMSIKARSLAKSSPHAVRRQPAEGRARQMPQRRGQGVPPR